MTEVTLTRDEVDEHVAVVELHRPPANFFDRDVLTAIADVGERAAAALESGRDASFDAYAAKLLADQNAAVSVRSGHQAHGAIGMTREYVLQDLTRRLNAWRGDWGTEQALAERIGGAVAAAGRIATVATDAGSLPV